MSLVCRGDSMTILERQLLMNQCAIMSALVKQGVTDEGAKALLECLNISQVLLQQESEIMSMTDKLRMQNSVCMEALRKCW